MKVSGLTITVLGSRQQKPTGQSRKIVQRNGSSSGCSVVPRTACTFVAGRALDGCSELAFNYRSILSDRWHWPGVLGGLRRTRAHFRLAFRITTLVPVAVRGPAYAQSRECATMYRLTLIHLYTYAVLCSRIERIGSGP